MDRALRAVSTGWRPRTWCGLVAVGVVAVSAVVVGPAQATFAGENGRLAFTAFDGPRQDVFTMAPDGSDVRNLTNDPNTDADASYSADGSMIAFYSLRDRDSEIYTAAVNGTDVRQLTTSGDNINPAFSPDGRIAFTSFRDGDAEIFVMNADGTGQTQLTSNDSPDSEPVFSPNGSQIAFQSFRDNADPPAPEIYIMNADGSNQTRLTTNPQGNGNPGFSPDGAQIVFTSLRDGNDPDGGEVVGGEVDRRTPEIYKMNADGSEQMRLTDDTSIDAEPVFSPDGSRIAFRSNRQDNRVLQVFTLDAADGSDIQQLTDEPGTKVLDDWGVQSDAPLDPPPPQPPQPPPPAVPEPETAQPLPPPGPPLTQPQRLTEVDTYGDWAAWSAFEEGVGYRLVLRDPDGDIAPAAVDPREVPFDVDLGPAQDFSVVAAYSRCEQEPDAYGAGGVLLRTTGRGCDLFRLDLASGRETKLEGASTQESSEYLPTIWRDSVGFARVFEAREGRRGELPYLYVRPLDGDKDSQRQPGGARGDDGLPGPTGLDLYGRRLSLTWEWRDGERLRSELRLDTVGGDHLLIDRLGSQEAPANIVTPVGERGRIFAGTRRLGGDDDADRLLRYRIDTNEYSEAPLQGPPLVGLGIDNGDFLLATADDPSQAPQCGPDGCLISPLDLDD